MTDPHMREAVGHLPTPEEFAEMAAEEAARRALLPRKVDPIPVRARYYLTKCEHCGWVGSSESCGLCLGWDDADVVCPACDQFIGALDPGKADEARHGDAVMARIEVAEALTLLLARALGETLNERDEARARIAELAPIYLPRRSGVYFASKTRHGAKWRELRARGVPIVSTWIDEAGAGETSCFTDLWRRCIDEAACCDALIVYREPGEILKGAFVEVGAALCAGTPVYAVGCEDLSFVNHPGVTQCNSARDAVERARALLSPPAPPAPPAQGGEDAR